MGKGVDEQLKSLMHKVLREEREVSPMTNDSWLRVSLFSGLCAREEVLCARTRVVRPNIIDSDLMLIFEHGHALHWGLQNRILPLTSSLYGRWLCGSCGTYYGGKAEWSTPLDRFQESQILRPKVCENCATELTSDNSLYQEQWIKDDEYRIAGHPDGFLRLDGLPGLGILEIKSANSRSAWAVRNCAQLDHVVQVQCYMWMTGCEWGKIVYWDKGSNGMKALIEHMIEYDEDHVEAIKNLIRDVWDGIRGTNLPSRICASATSSRAKLCSSVEACFSGYFKEGV